MKSKRATNAKQIHALCYGACVFFFAMGHTKIQKLCTLTNIGVNLGKMLPVLFSIFLFACIPKGFRFRKKVILWMSGFFALLTIAYLGAEMPYPVFLIAYFMIMCRNCSMKTVFKTYAIAVYSVILLTLLATALGYLENDNSWYGRYDLGFTYATFGPNLFLSAVLAQVCWRQKRMLCAEWMFVLLLNHFLYAKTNTDAVYLCIWALFLLVMLMRRRHIQRIVFSTKTIQFCLSHCAIILAILTICFQCVYNQHAEEPFFVWLNRTLSTRLIMGKAVFARYGTGFLLRELLFGLGPGVVTYLDSSFLQILTQYGIPMLLAFCLFMDRIIQYAWKERDLYLIVSVFVFMIHCITDPQLSGFRTNPIIITALICMEKSRKTSVCSSDRFQLTGENNKLRMSES